MATFGVTAASAAVRAAPRLRSFSFLPGLPGLSADKTTVTAEPVVTHPATSTRRGDQGSETAVGVPRVVPGIVEGSTADAHPALDSTVPAMPADTSDRAVDGDARRRRLTQMKPA